MMRWLSTMFSQQDDVIDAMIAEKGCRYQSGMDTPHQTIINRKGQRRWAEVLQAQRRLYKPAEELKVLRFKCLK